MKKTKLSPEVLKYFQDQGSKGGKAGAKRRMEVLTPEQRSTIAKKAADTRWSKKTAAKRPPKED